MIPSLPSPPKVSVIVAAYNSSRTMTRCLESLCALDDPAYEVIVVDDGSNDGTPDICGSFDGVRVMRLGRGGPSRARNVGIRAARGDIVAFTDSDCIVERDWLGELRKGFLDESVAGVGGDQKSPEDETEFGRDVQDFFKAIGFVTDYITSEKTLMETHHNPSCNSAYRKSVLEAIGGFAEDQFPCEDVEVDLKIRRLGYRLIYNPACSVGHFRPGSYGVFCRMMRRYGAGEWHLLRKHGFFRTLDYEPPAFIFCILAALALALWKPGLVPVLLLPFVVVLALFCAKSGSLRKGWRFTALFFLTLACWNLGFFTGFRYRPGR